MRDLCCCLAACLLIMRRALYKAYLDLLVCRRVILM